jgi:hypothetical protein
MDTEMLRLLLDAGADPNVVRIRNDGDRESLYDWAHAVYHDEVWQGHPFRRGETGGRRRRGRLASPPV